MEPGISEHLSGILPACHSDHHLYVGHWISFRIFYGTSGEKSQKHDDAFGGHSILTSALMRMYGWIIIFRSNGLLDKLLMGPGITEDPLKLLYSYPAVLVGMVYSLLPFMILSVYSSTDKMDWSLVEASRDLGATRLQAFLTVTVKMTLPGIMSGIVLVFIPSMGLFFIADILGGGKVMLVGNLIQNQLNNGRDWPFAAALSVVLMIFTSVMIWLYRKVTKVKDLEGLL